jgi:hypothetical protein
MHPRRPLFTVVAAVAAVCVAAPAQAVWEPEHRLDAAAPTTTDVAGAYVGTADDGAAAAVWLEWAGEDARIMMSRRQPSDAHWGAPAVAVDLVEEENVSGGGVGLNDVAVLPNGAVLVSYQEYDEAAEADHVGRVAKWRPDASYAGEQLSRAESAWQLEHDSQNDWVATAQEYDSCACEFYSWYSSGGRPTFLGTEPGMGVTATLGRRNLVYLAVLDDGALSDERTLRVVRINAATGERRVDPLLRPGGPVTGVDIDANLRGDVVLGFTVRRPERAVPDRVIAVRRVAGRGWGDREVLYESEAGNAALGAPQLGLTAAGEALVVWQTPLGGPVDLIRRVLRPGAAASRVRTVADDVTPSGRWLRFDLVVDDPGRALVVLQHRRVCVDGQACHAVSAVRGRVGGRFGESRLLLRSGRRFETVGATQSASGRAVVLAVERRSTAVRARAWQ